MVQENPYSYHRLHLILSVIRKLEDIVKMQYLKISFTGQLKAAISRMALSNKHTL